MQDARIAEAFEIVNAGAVGGACDTRQSTRERGSAREFKKIPAADCHAMSPRLSASDPIRLNRIGISSLCLSMISSENRFPLFRIMLQAQRISSAFQASFSLLAWKIEALASASASFDDAIALSKSPASAAFFAAAKAEAVTVH